VKVCINFVASGRTSLNTFSQVLRKYSDRTIAKSLIEELESYGGDVSHIVRSRKYGTLFLSSVCLLLAIVETLSRSQGSDSSGSTASDDEDADAPRYNNAPLIRHEAAQAGEIIPDGQARELPLVFQSEQVATQSDRPSSSISSHRYRTPLAGSLAMSPPPPQGLPATQPHPGFETPSAFAEPSPVSSPSYPTMSSYVGVSSESSRTRMATPTQVYPALQNYRLPLPHQPLRDYPTQPASRLTLERAVENVQVHLAALTERLESLETLTSLSRSHSYPGSGHASPGRGRRSPHGGRPSEWDLDDLGMWSIVLNPLSRGLEKLRELAHFFARNEDRSPTSIVVRRLCLDISFFVCLLIVARLLWKKGGVRRKEVRTALVILWRAILGTKPERMMIHRGV